MDLLIVLMAPLMVVTMAVVHAYAAPEQILYSMKALLFVVVLADNASSINFAVPVIQGGQLERVLRIVMLISGGLSIVGLIILPFAAMPAVRISIIGWGVAGSIEFL